MKVEELRIGNLVYGFRNKVIDLTGTYNHGEELVYSHAMILEMNQVKPIPLTEEWLVKFGFKQFYSERSFDGFTIEFFGEYAHYTGGEGCKFSPPIKYVHQLQNLYFALTGEEIKITEG